MTADPDGFDRLWSPWRGDYVKDPARKEIGGCVFCELPALGEERDRESLILLRGETAYLVLNAFPYNPGHLMAVPFRHVADYDALTAEELHEVGELCQRAVRALRACSGPHAFNVGVNAGGVAGAGIAEHIHQHVVPRWGGDTNFMPVVGHTRVLPELLADTYERLAPAFSS